MACGCKWPCGDGQQSCFSHPRLEPAGSFLPRSSLEGSILAEAIQLFLGSLRS